MDWLFLGDSSCNQALDPAVFAARTGDTALNLCVIGDLGVAHDAWILEGYLRRVGPPRKGVVVTHAYDVWHRRTNASLLGKLPLPWGFWTGLTPLNLDEKRQVFAARYIPMYVENISLRQTLAKGTAAFDILPVVDGNGFKAEPDADPAQVAKDAAGHRAFTRKHRYAMSRVNAAALDRLIAIPEEQHLPLYLVSSPLFADLPADNAFAAYYRQLDADLDRRVAGHSHVVRLFAEPMLFPAEQMVNVDHLTAAGAARFSAAVVEQLAPTAP